ncbi:hypothetical protein EDB85DRAFT_2246259 [Lactarius pseudohatsudake]|nr:hypothetical protein EDB85DRAFT_2246259 [Lactarius pseudohatsudake]
MKLQWYEMDNTEWVIAQQLCKVLKGCRSPVPSGSSRILPNPEPDFRSGSGNPLNFELNHRFRFRRVQFSPGFSGQFSRFLCYCYWLLHPGPSTGTFLIISSVTSALRLFVDVWFILVYSNADVHNFQILMVDLYGSYFFFALSSRLPLVALFVAVLALVVSLGPIAWTVWPAAVLVMCVLASVLVSLQFIVYGSHRLALGLAWMVRNAWLSVLCVSRRVRAVFARGATAAAQPEGEQQLCCAYWPNLNITHADPEHEPAIYSSHRHQHQHFSPPKPQLSERALPFANNTPSTCMLTSILPWSVFPTPHDMLSSTVKGSRLNKTSVETNNGGIAHPFRLFAATLFSSASITSTIRESVQSSFRTILWVDPAFKDARSERGELHWVWNHDSNEVRLETAPVDENLHGDGDARIRMIATPDTPDPHLAAATKGIDGVCGDNDDDNVSDSDPGNDNGCSGNVFKDATLFFSHNGTPNIATIIPAMDRIDEVLATSASDSQYSVSVQAALAMGKKTLNRYYSKTDHSKVYRIAMVLHPQHKLHYFWDAGWEEDWIETAEKIIRCRFETNYYSDSDETQVAIDEVATVLTSRNMFDDLPALTAPKPLELHGKFDHYLSTDPEYVPDVLAWWNE